MAVCIVKTKQEAKASKLAQILPQINQLQHVYLWYDKTFFLAKSFLSSFKRKTEKIFPENFLQFSVKLMPQHPKPKELSQDAWMRLNYGEKHHLEIKEMLEKSNKHFSYKDPGPKKVPF